MDQYRMTIAVMAATGVGVGPRDAEGRSRHYTAEELDALADFNMPGAGVVRRFAAGVAALRSRSPRRTTGRMESMVAPSTEAAVQV